MKLLSDVTKVLTVLISAHGLDRELDVTVLIHTDGRINFGKASNGSARDQIVWVSSDSATVDNFGEKLAAYVKGAAKRFERDTARHLAALGAVEAQIGFLKQYDVAAAENVTYKIRAINHVPV